MQQIPLTPAATQFLSQIMARGHENAAQIVETALARMAAEAGEDSPTYIAWIQAECRDALADLERGGGEDYDIEAILNEANTEFERGQMELNPSVIP
jgi:hypothetical protein